MAQANVFTTVTSQPWYTDKVRIATGTSAITLQVNSLYPATGNLYSMPIQLGPNLVRDFFVGVGNELTINGANFTAQEVGSATTGRRAVGA